MKDKYIDQYGIDSLPHLAVASEHGMDAFVTINEGLLEDREELERKFGIKIRSPGEMLDAIKLEKEQ